MLRTSRFGKNHCRVCTRPMSGNRLMFCLRILILSGSGKAGLPEDILSHPASFVIHIKETLRSTAVPAILTGWFSLSQKKRGYLMRHSIRTHKSSPRSWYVVQEEPKLRNRKCVRIHCRDYSLVCLFVCF